MTTIPIADNTPPDPDEIEEKMIALVKRVKVEGAYCCRVVSVIDLVDRWMTVRVRMRCQRHDDYSFDVEYGDIIEPGEQQDAHLMRRISNGIIDCQGAPHEPL